MWRGREVCALCGECCMDMLQISMKIGVTSTRRQKKGSSCRVTVRAVCTLAREYDGGGG
jgi:hypothetical protein